MNKKKLIFIILLCLTIFVLANAALAGGITSQVETFSGKVGLTKQSSIPQMGAMIIKALLTFVGIIFFGLIIYSGYLYMTAAGEQEKLKKAKETFVKAAIGLLIIISAYAITSFVINAISGTTPTTPGASPTPGGSPPPGGYVP